MLLILILSLVYFFNFFLNGICSLNRYLFTRVVKFQNFHRSPQGRMSQSRWLGQKDAMSAIPWMGIFSSTRNKSVIYNFISSFKIRQGTSTLYSLLSMFVQATQLCNRRRLKRQNLHRVNPLSVVVPFLTLTISNISFHNELSFSPALPSLTTAS